MRDSDMRMFDRICGNCAGVDMWLVTEQDVLACADALRRAGEEITEDEGEAAIRGMREYREDARRRRITGG